MWKIENRHSYTDVSPQGFGFDQGYVGLIEPPFSDEGTRLTNLYWRQRFNDGKSTVVAGMLDVTDFVDVYALASPWTGFMNFAFSTGSAAMFIPNDATFGIDGGTMLGDKLFLIGSIANAYTDPTARLIPWVISLAKMSISPVSNWAGQEDRIVSTLTTCM